MGSDHFKGVRLIHGFVNETILHFYSLQLIWYQSSANSEPYRNLSLLAQFLE